MHRSIFAAITFALAICVPIAGYVAWPYLSAQTLRQAFEAGDVVTLNRKVHWPSVRSSIKDMLAAEMMRDLVKDEPGMSDAAKAGAGFAAMLAPVMLDKLVDSFITPQGLLALIGGGPEGSARDGNKPKLRDDFIRRAALVGPTRFEVEFGNQTAATGQILAVMEFTDFDWKLTQLFFLKPPTLR